MYPGGPAGRNAAIEEGAGRHIGDLRLDLDESAERLLAAFANFDAEGLAREVEGSRGSRWLGWELPLIRMREVEIHHVDLVADYTPPTGQLVLRLRTLDQVAPQFLARGDCPVAALHDDAGGAAGRWALRARRCPAARKSSPPGWSDVPTALGLRRVLPGAVPARTSVELSGRNSSRRSITSASARWSPRPRVPRASRRSMRRSIAPSGAIASSRRSHIHRTRRWKSRPRSAWSRIALYSRSPLPESMTSSRCSLNWTVVHPPAPHRPDPQSAPHGDLSAR